MNDSELIDRMVQRLAAELKRLLHQVQTEQVPVAAVEGLLRERFWHMGSQALGVILEAWDRQLTAGRPVHDYRTRTIVSLFGPVDIARGRCRTEDGRCCPLDEAMGLQGHRGWTRGVQEAVSLLSCDCSFETVSDLMQRLFGLSISPPSVQQVTEAVGQRAESLLAEASTGESSVVKPQGEPVPDTLIVAADGCQAPQRDGWREVKVATLYPKASRCRKGSGRPTVVSKNYFATLENAEQFGEALYRCAEAWGGQQIRRTVVMGDGAAWIWSLSEMRFPGALEIVDFYHAAEHLWEVGEALWGDRHTSAATRAWVRRYCKLLKKGRIDLVLCAVQRGLMQRGGGLSGAALKAVQVNLRYFQKNRTRMRYGRFRQMGLPIGTGVVEGSCKFVVQSRFKRAGMRWSREGLASMLALKLLRVNRHWERLWPHMEAA